MRNAPLKILRLVWRVEPDLVFSTLAHLNLTLAALRSFMPGKSAFIGREGTIVTQMLAGFKHAGLWRAAVRALYPRFDVMVCQSRYMQADLVENHGLPREKSVVINNPVDRERVTRDLPPRRRRVDVRSPLRLVAAGRFGPEKGFDLLVEALALVRDLEISLCILGDGPLLPEVQKQISRLELDGVVTLAGFQANPFRYFAEADAFVLSSRVEGFPNVVLEALACGIGVIATPAIGGTREILEGVPGCVLANEVSAPALAAAIRDWATRPFDGIASSVLDKYDAGVIADQYSRLFERVCDQRYALK
jgi:glycosyltransferase involved in cell wall biosynthesis